MNTPQPFPYQGSKRHLAPEILAYLPDDCVTFVEPFAGSAAMSIAVASRKLAQDFVINDFNAPLADLWREIINDPHGLAERYSLIWHAQGHGQEIEFYNSIRSEFNHAPRPDKLLFLLARCVKAAVRYNRRGEFNQSADPRRRGMIPTTMRGNLLATSALFRGRTRVASLDYAELCVDINQRDVIYMDPPYQGVCKERDKRYSSSLTYPAFVKVLREMNTRGLSYLVSYDGRTGERKHGELLPDDLELTLVEIEAGRSSQATLLGREEMTIESLYLSAPLAQRLKMRAVPTVAQPLLV